MAGERPLGPSDLARRAAQAAPGRTALVDERSRLTWQQLDDAVNAAAGALLARDLDAGDRVSLQLPTGTDFVVLYLAALRAGLVAVPVNPSYTGPEVEHIRSDSGSALHLDAATARELLAQAPPAPDPRRDRGGEALAALLYTSGTSGRGKGAMLSARALLANIEQVLSVRPPLICASDVVLVPLPLSHVFGLNAGLGIALGCGATVVLADRFDPAATLAAMAREQVSVVLGVPGQFAAWLADPGLVAGFAGVRFAMSGSAKLGRGVVDAYARAVGVTVHDGYGLTEAAPVVSVNAVGDHPAPNTVGHSLPGVQVQLRDLWDGEPVEDDGDPGRIFVRGANLFSGYWPEATDGPDDDGWFGTGDIAVADEHGNLRLVGRSADLVIVNGFNVYPAEVEAVLADAEGVAEVAVVGTSDDRTGEAVRAYVVPVRGATLNPEDLLAHAAASLARFKVPTSVEIVSALPRTVTGKIMKWQLERGDADGRR